MRRVQPRYAVWHGYTNIGRERSGHALIRNTFRSTTNHAADIGPAIVSQTRLPQIAYQILRQERSLLTDGGGSGCAFDLPIYRYAVHLRTVGAERVIEQHPDLCGVFD